MCARIEIEWTPVQVTPLILFPYAFIKGPGSYEITYLVISDNFPPAKLIAKLELGNKLNAISFTKIENELGE